MTSWAAACARALYNYMHGVGLDADVREWFEPRPAGRRRGGRHHGRRGSLFSVPVTTVPPDLSNAFSANSRVRRARIHSAKQAISLTSTGTATSPEVSCTEAGIHVQKSDPLREACSRSSRRHRLTHRSPQVHRLEATTGHHRVRLLLVGSAPCLADCLGRRHRRRYTTDQHARRAGDGRGTRRAHPNLAQGNRQSGDW